MDKRFFQFIAFFLSAVLFVSGSNAAEAIKKEEGALTVVAVDLDGSKFIIYQDKPSPNKDEDIVLYLNREDVCGPWPGDPTDYQKPGSGIPYFSLGRPGTPMDGRNFKKHDK